MVLSIRLVVCCGLAAAVFAAQETQTPLSYPVPKIRYVECDSSIQSERLYDCGQIDVPLDWNNPEIGSITLNFTALTVQNRVQRKGTVFYHPGLGYLGRRFEPHSSFRLMLYAKLQLESVVHEYDLVAWTTREDAIAERVRCFAIDDVEQRRFLYPGFGAHESQQIAFYNDTYLNDLQREPPWDDRMAWTRTQGPQDVKDMLYAQEKLIAHCLDNVPGSDLFKYVGTAATTRDIAALADAIDGSDSPINIWTKHHGSFIATHLLKMLPERVGRVVMDDPADPMTYQVQETYKQWAVDIATVNNTAAHIQLHDMRNGSTGYMPFWGHPVEDSGRMDMIIQFLHSELVEWYTRSEADHHTMMATKRFELRLSADRRDHLPRHTRSPRHSLGVNGWRSTGHRSTLAMSVLDGMSLVCGDALYEHDAESATERAEVEAFLVENMYVAPLIASSAFPPLRYLCHLWPIRAAERVALHGPYEPTNVDSQVLILLHNKDYWNYFTVTEDLAHERWPTATVVGGLHYGDLVWDHDQCSLDIVKAFYSNGMLPDGPRPCQYYEGHDEL